MVTSVECNARARRATIEWVEQMIKKHESLPTDKLVLVSKAGFTKSALGKAKALNVDALTISEASATDWTTRLPSVQLDMLVPKLKSVHVDLCGQSLSDEQRAAVRDARLRDRGGVDHGSLYDFVGAWVSGSEMTESLRARVPSGHSGQVDTDVPLPPGAQLVFEDGTTRPIGRIRATAICERQVSDVPMTAAAYGTAPVATGETSMLGRTAWVIAGQLTPGDRRLSIIVTGTRSKRPVPKDET